MNRRTIRTPEQLFEYLGAADEAGASRRLYKDTACGAWLDASDARSFLIGTIVEGSDVEPVVSPRRLYYPVSEIDVDRAIQEIEADAEVVWGHISECSEECDGERCGYTSHAGSMEVIIGPVPRDLRPRPLRRFRVRLSRSIIGFVPIRVRDTKSHRTVELPKSVTDWLGCSGPRNCVPYDTHEGQILSSLFDGSSNDHESRRRGSSLWITTDPLHP
jgi:hypothetical protein